MEKAEKYSSKIGQLMATIILKVKQLAFSKLNLTRLTHLLKSLILFNLLFFLPFRVVGFSVIDRIGLKEGLSNSSVRAIYQDHQGYIWFGTDDGLNRYNGYYFKIYRNLQRDNHSLTYNVVSAINEDRQHKLWVGTRRGISILDPVSQKFEGVYAAQPGQTEKKLVNSNISSIQPTPAGHIFVASYERGLLLFSGNSHTGIEIPYEDVSGKHWNYKVVSLDVYSEQRIFLLIYNVGLCFYDTQKRSVQLLNPNVSNPTSLHCDHSGVWVGTNAGLFHYNLAKHSFDLSYDEVKGALSSNRISQIITLPNKEVWVATDGGGINIRNETSGKFTTIEAGSTKYTLSSNAVRTIFIDKQGRKWIGTLRGGINIIDDAKGKFQNIEHDPTDANSLINPFVKSVFEDRSGKIWIGTDGGGLSIWDRENNKFENFRHKQGVPNTLSSNFITGICQDFSNKVWVATYGAGINLYLPNGKTFKSYLGYNGKGKPFSTLFWVVYEDRKKNLWLSGLQDGLFLYNRKEDRFDLYDPSLKDILVLKEDRNGQLWGGTWDGLFAIDTRAKTHRYDSIEKPVRSILEDKNSNLWLGTEAGLMLFDRVSHRVIKTYTTEDGLSNDNVLNIEEDREGHLWLSTYNGLSRFDVKKKVFTNFSETDGLQNKQFNFNASIALRSGELAFGGLSGLSLFDPKRVLPQNESSTVVIDELKINNVSITERPTYISGFDQTKVTALTIPYNDAVLSISFAAINFTSQQRINYRYIMSGWDRGWNNIGHLRNAVYTRLNAGTYNLKIECTNAEGKWLNKPLILKITVLPPWYMSWWAYLCYAIIFCSALYWYLSYRSRETRLKYEIKLAKVNASNQLLLQEKEREINEKRVEFFTGIAHEFRTPLSMIINPVSDMISRSDAKDLNDLNIVFRNARRLLSLVDQLLLFRKADDSVNQLNIAPIHITQLCKEVYLCFVQQAKTAGLSFEFQAINDEMMIYADREKIEIILYNLISNAIKYTPRGKAIRVVVQETPSMAVITVVDNGHGIPTNVGNQLFEKFYRSNEPGKPFKSGFGIGLFLAKQFTQYHQGTLSYTSLPEKETIFKLELKKGTAHFPQIFIAENEMPTSGLLSEIVNDQMPLDEPISDEFQVENIFSDKNTILIIDDDTEIRQYIKGLLEPKYVIYDAENGENGLAIAKEKLPSLIICDVMMPGLNGIELCAIIKNDPLLNYIPMILLTASSTPEGKIKGLESGADDYISKPFEKNVLVARVANLLQIRSNLQSYFYSAVTLRSSDIAISEEYKQFLEKCIDIVEKHLTDANFNTNVLASEIGMSRSNLFRKVKSLSGHSIISFIRYIRLRKAAELLIQSDLNVNQVALETGFIDIKYFRTQFFKLFGLNPSDFIRQKRPVFKKR